MFEQLKSASVSISIFVIALVVFFLPGNEWLQFDTSMACWQQPLQLFSCHVLHWSTNHLFWDLAMFLITAVICERISRTSFLGVLILSAIAIPPLTGMYHIDVDSYRGLSGIDTALFAMAAMRLGIEAAKEKEKLGSLIYAALLSGMFFKIGHELITGGTFFVNSDNFIPVPMAHLVGASVGLFAAWTDQLIVAIKKSAQPHSIKPDHGLRTEPMQ